MKNSITITISSLIIAISMHGNAADNFYIEGKFGLSSPSNIKPDRKNSNNEDYIGSKLQNSTLYSLGAGYLINDRFALGIFLDYNSNFKYHASLLEKENNFTTTGKVRSLTTMLNGYYNLLDSSHMIIPYIGAGIGISRNTLTDRTVLKDGGNFKIMKGATSSNFSWNLLAGSSVKINKNTQVILEYKYMDLGKIKTGANHIFPEGTISKPITKTNLRAHSFLVGLRYNL